MANATEKVTLVKLDRKQTAFVEKDGCNGVGIISGSVQDIGEAMAQYGCQGCQVVFDTYAAPNFKRCFNAAVKRAGRIATVAGVSLSEPAEYFIDGHHQRDKWVMIATAPEKN